MDKFTGSFFLLITSALIAQLHPVSVQAADPAVVAANYVEAGAGYHSLSSGYPDWRGLYVSGSWQQNAENVWDWQVLHEDRWDNWETLLGGGLTHTFNDDWYGSLHGTYSGSGFFFPAFSVAAFINRKLLETRNLVAHFGVMYDEAKDDLHTDKAIYLGASYYFPQPWVVGAGIRRNRSSPGPVYSSRYNLSLSYGRELDRTLVGEVDWGRESYQLVDESTSLVDFHSERTAITWREWVRPDWGFNVSAEYYSNEFYDRRGVTIGVFKHF